jgi:hypothetical protein
MGWLSVACAKVTQQSAAGVIEMTIDIDTQSMTVFLNNIQEKENFAGTELLLSKKFIGANQNFLLANRFHSNFFTVFSRVVAYRAQQQMKTSNISNDQVLVRRQQAFRHRKKTESASAWNDLIPTSWK